MLLPPLWVQGGDTLDSEGDPIIMEGQTIWFSMYTVYSTIDLLMYAFPKLNGCAVMVKCLDDKLLPELEKLMFKTPADMLCTVKKGSRVSRLQPGCH